MGRGASSKLQVPKAHERLTETAALDAGVGRLRYVRGKRADALDRLGLRSVRDLLLHVPIRYLDFSRVSTIGDAEVGQQVTIVAAVDRIRSKRPRPRLDILEVYLADPTGILRLSFFRQPWLRDRFHKGDLVAVSGKVTFSYGFKAMTPAFHEVVAEASEGERAASGQPGAAGALAQRARVLPVHGVTEGLSAAWMRRIVSAALVDAGGVCDFVPADLIARLGLISEANALRWAHFPPSLDAAEAARRRLAFDELLCLQVGLHLRRLQGRELPKGFAHVTDGPHAKAVVGALPFSLTADQRRAVDEILAGMAEERPMNRLLQGDVGTGKTAVAAVALGAVADSQAQAAVMAPTSVLARQYTESLGPVLDRAGVSWRLVTGATPAAERAETARLVAEGEVTVVFGTTALLSGDIAFPKLTFVVVDEQHRFGVNQRIALAGKAARADVLSMTATPIPRTLALSVYGDVSVSTMSERPRPGAGVSTKLVSPGSIDEVWDAIREAVAAGRQAYVVCPLVDDADDGSALGDWGARGEGDGKAERRLASAVATQRNLQRKEFQGLRVGLLHGRLSAQEKDEVMSAMREGTIDVLVTTTVVEVGVDVPNATVMAILDADRFGLATLHQLRGRVGRGDAPGRALLVADAKRGSAAWERLKALERTDDGFELAELDLKLRHEGEVLGYRQSGEVTFRLVDLLGDRDLIEAAHEAAKRICLEDPALEHPDHGLLEHEVRSRYGRRLEGGDG